jgi:hypothetical protein
MVQTWSGRAPRPRFGGERLSIAACLAGLAAAGCGEALGLVCTADFRYGLSINVTAQGAPAAEGAEGIAIDGAYVETLELLAPGTLLGAGERPGTYDVTITKTGYMTWSAQDVRVDADECHVIGVALEASLIPVP